jgi:hypothetical protein
VLAVSLVVIGLGCLGFVLGDELGVYFGARFAMGLGSGGLWMAVTFSPPWSGRRATNTSP